ncbi:type II secretion system protein J [uncultured Azohydromonas sp.]|jgi:prepilin-type N-terminal cleavage/methylation domain|uniref:PulJ/GspJ family protein n=1 Tax=uncultured Azohydromonas sp. TaxID=487342 RepID=UPI002601AC3E|nr:prepilin-type N-terminal cleavage/methylation domain-containing protein [uncultured Azohydromonas sp.]
MRTRAGGFTLVEVLVALLVMSVMAGLAWRGIDGLARAREATEANLETTQRLNTVMAQLEADLQAVYDTQGVVPAVSCDGATLRLTRTAEDGVQLVAWQLRSPLWMRWASPAVVRAGELQEQWMRSQQLMGNEPNQLRLLEGVTGMQIYVFRGNAWTNCQSSAGTTTTPTGAIGALPNPTGTQPDPPPAGVRIVLSLTRPREGTLTRSIALNAQ